MMYNVPMNVNNEVCLVRQINLTFQQESGGMKICDAKMILLGIKEIQLEYLSHYSSCNVVAAIS